MENTTHHLPRTAAVIGFPTTTYKGRVLDVDAANAALAARIEAETDMWVHLVGWDEEADFLARRSDLMDETELRRHVDVTAICDDILHDGRFWA